MATWNLVGGKAERVDSPSLEQTQQFGNAQRVAQSRVSGSNDPHQVQHDAREQQIKLSQGAAALAAGRELGLSEEETLSLLSVGKELSIWICGTRADMARKRAQAQATITDQAERAEIDGTTTKNKKSTKL